MKKALGRWSGGLLFHLDTMAATAISRGPGHGNPAAGTRGGAMRHTRLVLCSWGALLLIVLGCTNQPDLRPPTQPACYDVPSENDKRYSEPFKYPPEVLADNPVKQSMPQQGPQPLRSGGKMGGGMGGGMGASMN